MVGSIVSSSFNFYFFHCRKTRYRYASECDNFEILSFVFLSGSKLACGFSEAALGLKLSPC
jgi:hypothetical protein